jgi:hypothetical protein
MGRNPVLGPWPHNATLGQPTDSGAQAAPEHGEGIELPARACTQRPGSEANGGERGNMEARMTRTSIWIPLEPRWVGRATQKLTIEAQPRRRQKTGAIAAFSGGLSALVAGKGVGNFLQHEAV